MHVHTNMHTRTNNYKTRDGSIVQEQTHRSSCELPREHVKEADPSKQSRTNTKDQGALCEGFLPTGRRGGKGEVQPSAARRSPRCPHASPPPPRGAARPGRSQRAARRSPPALALLHQQRRPRGAPLCPGSFLLRLQFSPSSPHLPELHSRGPSSWAATPPFPLLFHSQKTC